MRMIKRRRELRRRDVLVAGGILVGYLITRLSLLWRFPPPYDEGGYALFAHDASTGNTFAALDAGKDPLLSWLGALQIQLFDINPLTSIRVVSLLSGVVTMVVTALIAYRLGGRRAALAVGVLYLVLPFVFVYDVLGIMEPLITALLATALYLQLRLASRPRLQTAILLGIAMGAALLTKESGQFALALLPVSVVCVDWSRPGLRKRLLTWLGYAAVSVVIAAALLSIEWLHISYGHLKALRDGLGLHRDLGEVFSQPLRVVLAVSLVGLSGLVFVLTSLWQRRSALILAVLLAPSVVGAVVIATFDRFADVRPLVEMLTGYLTVPLIGLLALGFALTLLRDRRTALVLSAWIVFPTAVAILIANANTSRYLLVTVPVIVVLMALGFTALIRAIESISWRSNWQMPAAVVVVGLLLLLPALRFDKNVLANPNNARYPGVDDVDLRTGWTAGTGLKPLADELRRRARVSPKPVVIGCELLCTDSIRWILNDDAQFKFVSIVGGEHWQSARFVLKNGRPFEAKFHLGKTKLIWQFRRGSGGMLLQLYERTPSR